MSQGGVSSAPLVVGTRPVLLGSCWPEHSADTACLPCASNDDLQHNREKTNNFIHLIVQISLWLFNRSSPVGCFLTEDSLDLWEPCGWVISVPTSTVAGHSECRADGCPGAPRRVAASDIPCDTAQLIWSWCRESDGCHPGCIPSLGASLASHSSGSGVFLCCS